MSDIGDGMELAFSDKIAVPLSEHRKALDEIVRLRAEVARKDAALRPLACTCEAKHQAECSRSEVDCPFWNARAALTAQETKL